MDCCRPPRRQALLRGSLAAAVPAIMGRVSVESAKASTTDLLATGLEVATVTGTSVIITWFTGPATEAGTHGFPLPAAAGTTLQIGLVGLTTLTVVPGALKTALESPAQSRNQNTSWPARTYTPDPPSQPAQAWPPRSAPHGPRTSSPLTR
jgi:hypothetical protein